MNIQIPCYFLAIYALIASCRTALPYNASKQKQASPQIADILRLSDYQLENERRSYIVDQYGRNDIAQAIEMWSRDNGVVLDLELLHGIWIEALNAEFQHMGSAPLSELRAATSSTVSIYLNSVIMPSPEAANPSYEDPTSFPTLLRDQLGILGIGPSPPGLKRYRYGRLYVECTPSKATIAINGKELGLGNAMFALPEGKHKVLGKKNGYSECVQSVEIFYRQLTISTCQLRKLGL